MNKQTLFELILPEKKHRLHLDHHVRTGKLYSFCLEVPSEKEKDDITKQPTVDIDSIDYSDIYYLDIKLYYGCFNDDRFINVLKKFISTPLSRNIRSEWVKGRGEIVTEGYKVLHVNTVLDPLFHTKNYEKFIKYISSDGVLIDRIILEIHEKNHTLFSDRNNFLKFVEEDVLKFPKFPAIQYVVRNDIYEYPMNEIYCETFFNTPFLMLCEDEKGNFTNRISVNVYSEKYIY